MSLNVRQKFLVDRKLQLAIVFRGMVYWCFCVASIGCLMMAWWMVSRPDVMIGGAGKAIWQEFGPPLLVSMLLLPVVVLDAVKVSNRMAGPMHRLRKAMHALADGERVAPLSVREKDHWREVIEDFNRIAARLQTKPDDEFAAERQALLDVEAAEAAQDEALGAEYLGADDPLKHALAE